MEKEFVPYEQALALKELGFDEPCIQQYSYDGAIMFCVNDWGQPKFKTNKESLSDSGGDCISAPTFSQAFRFFREKYNFDVGIAKDSHNIYHFQIDTNHYGNWILPIFNRKYEKAELECLKKLIEIIKR